MCSLSEVPAKAATPAPPSPQQNEWLKGVPAVARAVSNSSRRTSGRRQGKSKKKSKSGGLQSGRSTRSSVSGGPSDTEGIRQVSSGHGGYNATTCGLARRLHAALEAAQGAGSGCATACSAQAVDLPPAAADAAGAAVLDPEILAVRGADDGAAAADSTARATAESIQGAAKRRPHSCLCLLGPGPCRVRPCSEQAGHTDPPPFDSRGLCRFGSDRLLRSRNGQAVFLHRVNTRRLHPSAPFPRLPPVCTTAL